MQGEQRTEELREATSLETHSWTTNSSEPRRLPGVGQSTSAGRLSSHCFPTAFYRLKYAPVFAARDPEIASLFP